MYFACLSVFDQINDVFSNIYTGPAWTKDIKHSTFKIIRV